MPKNARTKRDGVLLTVSGFLSAMSPAKGRPGCVLEMSDGKATGRYYVPLPPHDCRRMFPERTHVRFRVWASQEPDKNGVIDTAGPADRLWDVVTA